MARPIRARVIAFGLALGPAEPAVKDAMSAQFAVAFCSHGESAEATGNTEALSWQGTLKRDPGQHEFMVFRKSRSSIQTLSAT